MYFFFFFSFRWISPILDEILQHRRKHPTEYNETAQIEHKVQVIDVYHLAIFQLHMGQENSMHNVKLALL